MSTKHARRRKRQQRKDVRSRRYPSWPEHATAVDDVVEYEITEEAIPDVHIERLPAADRERLGEITQELSECPSRFVTELEALVRRFPHVPKFHNYLFMAY